LNNEPIKEFKTDQLNVAIYNTRSEMGRASAAFVATQIAKVMREKGEVRMVFAAAVSQLEFIEGLLKREDVKWDKITAFHMDEYHTLQESAPQRFGNFLKERLFKHRNFNAVYYMNDIEDYAKLINESPIDIVCLGIGENGHLAFNDPPVADFNDPKTVKEVELDEICRQQQVNDGEFSSIQEVPKTALTLTMPALINAKFLSVVVPGTSKASAVKETLYGQISTDCPSTSLRNHPNAKLFLDTNSSKLIHEN